MAVTVEELQILLSCDAAQAEAVLDAITKKVDSAVKKMQGKLDGAMDGGGTGGSKKQTSYYDALVKKISTAREKMNEALSGKQAGTEGADVNYNHWSQQVGSLTKRLEKLRDTQKNVNETAAEMRDIPIQYPQQGKGGYQPWSRPVENWQASQERSHDAVRYIESDQRQASRVDAEKLAYGTPYEKLHEQFVRASEKVDELAAKLRQLQEEGGSPKAIDALESKLETASNKADRLAEKMAKIEDKATGGNGAGEDIKQTGDAAQDAVPKIEKYNNAVKDTGKSSSFFSKASKFAHGMFDKFGKSFKHHEGFLSKFGKTLKRVMMRMLAMGLIRGVINGVRQGLQLLAQSSSAAAEQYGRFTAMSKGVKAALGGAALAVLNAFSGVLYSIASAAIAAANAVAAFFAVIGGSSTYIGVTLADSFDNLGDSIGGAGGAAKGLLADFDELNIIGQQGGGGGGGGLNGTSGVGTEEMSAASILADLLKAEQFEQAGAYIAQKLDEVVLKIDNWFVKLDEKHYGEKFARVLNGIFSDKKLFEDSGKAIGDGLNVVIHAFDEFTNTFDGKQAGEALAAGVNTMVDTVDWESAGRAVSQGLNKITDAIRGFFDNFDGDALGASLASTINNAILGIDASSIGAALNVVFINAIDFLISLLANMDWFGIFSGIIEFILSWPMQVLEGRLSRPSRILRIIKNFIKLIIKATVGLFAGALAGMWNAICDMLIADANAIVPGLGDELFGDARAMSDKFKKGFEEGLDQFLEPIDRVADELDKKMGFMDETTSEHAEHISKSLGEHSGSFGKFGESVDGAASALEGSMSILDSYKANAEGLATSIDKVSDSINGIPSYKETTIKINTVATGSGTNGGGGGGGNTNVNVVLMKMARGGIAYGDTLAHIGEYPNVRSNPEVVAPLSDLQGILAKTGSNSADVKRQNELLSEQNKLLRVIAAKEIKLSPTPELGQVVTKAQALYGAV